jgi:hypothetical protein
VSIAAALLYLLARFQTTFESTQTLVRRTSIRTIETGCATSIVALACIIVFKALPDTTVQLVGINEPAAHPHFEPGRVARAGPGLQLDFAMQRARPKHRRRVQQRVDPEEQHPTQQLPHWTRWWWRYSSRGHCPQHCIG